MAAQRRRLHLADREGEVGQGAAPSGLHKPRRRAQEHEGTPTYSVLRRIVGEEGLLQLDSSNSGCLIACFSFSSTMKTIPHVATYLVSNWMYSTTSNAFPSFRLHLETSSRCIAHLCIHNSFNSFSSPNSPMLCRTMSLCSTTRVS